MNSAKKIPEAKKSFGNASESKEDNEVMEAQLYADMYYMPESHRFSEEPAVTTINDIRNIQKESNEEIAKNVDGGNLRIDSENSRSKDKTPEASIAPTDPKPGLDSLTNSSMRSRTQIIADNKEKAKKRLRNKARKGQEKVGKTQPANMKHQETHVLRKNRNQYLTFINEIDSEDRWRNLEHPERVQQQIWKTTQRCSTNTHVYFEDDETHESTVQDSDVIQVPNEDRNEETQVPNEDQNIEAQVPNEEAQSSKNADENQDTARTIECDIVELSSLSSDLEEKNKYNVEVKKKKRLKKASKKVSQDDSESDESIFEVPVPPKPAPPVIDLDEDNEGNVGIDDSSSSIEENSKFFATSLDSDDSFLNQDPTETPQHKDDEVPVVAEKTISIDLTINEDTEDNIILNCTEVQKGVSSLEEIKQMRDSVTVNTDEAIQINGGISPSTSKKRTHDTIDDSNGNEEPGERPYLQPSKKLKAFYDDSWGGENYNLEDLMRKMSKDRRRWAILDADLAVGSVKNLRRYWNAKCANCQRNGHDRKKCPEAIRPVCCHMCGAEGHKESRCSQKMCLTCGRMQGTYRATCEQCRSLKCMICQSLGHRKDSCPDLWRRYHHTTTNEDIDTPANVKNIMKPQRLLNCCNCTRSGHESFNCGKYRWSSHFPSPAFVTKYKDNTSLFQTQVRNPFSQEMRENAGRTCNGANAEPVQSSIVNQPPSQDIASIPTPLVMVPNPLANASSASKPQNPVEPIKWQEVFSFFVPPENADVFCKIAQGIRDEVGETILANKVDPSFLQALYNHVVFSVEVVWNGSNGLRITVKTTSIAGKLILELCELWLQRTMEEQRRMIMFPPKKDVIVYLLEQMLPKFNTLQGQPQSQFTNMKRLQSQLKQTGVWQSNVVKNGIFEKYYKTLTHLVMLLYKYNCGEGSANIGILNKSLAICKNLSLDDVPCQPYTIILYQVNSIFAPHEPEQLKQMLQKYSRECAAMKQPRKLAKKAFALKKQARPIQNQQRSFNFPEPNFHPRPELMPPIPNSAMQAPSNFGCQAWFLQEPNPPQQIPSHPIFPPTNFYTESSGNLGSLGPYPGPNLDLGIIDFSQPLSCGNNYLPLEQLLHQTLDQFPKQNSSSGRMQQFNKRKKTKYNTKKAKQNKTQKKASKQ